KALYISLTCHGLAVMKVLIDNGSALNVIPLSTLEHLHVDKEEIKSSLLVVKAFD
ncbi:hypothetical protein M569_00011, partial [Genlisea aurea]